MLRSGVILSWMVEQHVKVPSIRSDPERKQTGTSRKSDFVLIVSTLQTASPSEHVSRMCLMEKRNFRGNRIGKIIVMPMNAAYPAIITS